MPLRGGALEQPLRAREIALDADALGQAESEVVLGLRHALLGGLEPEPARGLGSVCKKINSRCPVRVGGGQ